jgi:predicted HAD superfamily Cof-like phosphohydrolase
MNNFERVIEFNKCFGLPHYDDEQTNVISENPKLSDLRINLCDEEIEELSQAFKTNDFIEVIDALTDELYVVYGAASSFGFNINDMISEFTKNNTSETNYTKILNYHGKDIREFTKLNYKDHLKSTNVLSSLLSKDLGNYCYKMLSKLVKYIEDLKRFRDENNFSELKKTLSMLLYNTYLLGIMMNINLDISFEIVHKSNMSKLCNTEPEAHETVSWYKNNDNRYDTPSYRLSYNKKYWVIFNESTGKILKNVNYTSANFEVMLR